MNVLMLGGTRFFGRYAVRELIAQGHNVTIATRGTTPDAFGDTVQRIRLDRSDAASLRENLSGRHFDAVIDNICYCSNDVRNLLDVITCDRYVMTSSTAVYAKHIDTCEAEFDPLSHPLEWCGRAAHPYEEVKRQAEAALFQRYTHINAAAVRYPFVIGSDDYTNRLRFYIDHAMTGAPMYVDNIDHPMGFIRSDEAGKFLARMAESDFRGSINGASSGAISVGEILAHVEKRTGRRAILTPDGAPAPYNGENAYTINTDRATGTGFAFTPLETWIYDLIDDSIAQNR